MTERRVIKIRAIFAPEFYFMLKDLCAHKKFDDSKFVSLLQPYF